MEYKDTGRSTKKKICFSTKKFKDSCVFYNIEYKDKHVYSTKMELKDTMCSLFNKKRILRLIVLQQINKRKLSFKYKINSKHFLQNIKHSKT